MINLPLPELKKILYRYAADGWHLFPCCWVDEKGNCACGQHHKDNNIGKAPLVAKWQDKGSTNTHAGIDEFLSKYPHCNVGGWFPNQYIVDVDTKHEGFASFEKIKTDIGDLPKTRTHRTQSGGFHFIYQQPSGTDIKKDQNYKGYTGIDIQTNGTYILLPPSVGVKGAYTLINDSLITEIPKTWLDLTPNPDAPKKQKPMGKENNTENGTIPGGEQHRFLVSRAGEYRNKGDTPEQILEKLKVDVLRCPPDKDREPWAENDLTTIAKSTKSWEAGATFKESRNPPVIDDTNESHDDDDEIANTVKLVWMDTIAPETVDWLWYPYIPLGKLTILEGDPGVGKSWILLAIATAISLGRGLPRVDVVPKGIVLIASAEDGKADTIRPRLNNMGADTSKIVIIDDPEARFTLDDLGCDMLEKFINEVKPLVLILDPLVAYINADIDISQANQMRHITKKLATLAEKYKVAIIALRHLTKGGSSKPIYRGLGSIDITAAARSVLMAGEDSDTGARGIVHIKSNLAQKGNPIGYSLTDKFYWTDGDCDLTVARILSNDSGGMPIERAKVFLEEYLKDGAKPEKEIEDEAAFRDISERTLKRAKSEVGVKSFSRPEKGKRGAGTWYWELTYDEQEK
jgi:hypothetical protein